MFSIRKPWWAALTAAALVAGCASEEPPAAVPAANTPHEADLPGASKADEPKDAAKAPPATPAEPKKDETAPKVEAPKDDAPKVEAPKVEPPKVEAPKVEAPKTEAPKTAAAGATAEELAEIEKLPADEQELALKQLNCPVSDEHLGAMGVPIKVTAEGKTFFICCKGCKKDVEANPKAVVAKLTK